MSFKSKLMCRFNRVWSEQEIGELIGEKVSSTLAYANDDTIRLGAASGGVVTALLVHALENHQIVGAITLSSYVENNQICCEPKMCVSRQELLDCQGSVYTVVPSWLNKTVHLVAEAPGKVAVVGLPCHIRMLRKKIERTPELKERVSFTIALFCGHTTRPELSQYLLSQLSKEQQQDIRNFRFRIGHWRGRSLVEFKNREMLSFPYSRYGLYQNLFFFCAKKCLSCGDHFGYEADISVGDAWLYQLKGAPFKYSSVIIKTKAGEDIWADAVTQGVVTVKNCDITDILEGQRRSALFHYRVSARVRAGRHLGIKIYDATSAKTSLLDFCIAWLLLLNWRFSQDSRAGVIFKIPVRLLKGYLYFIKALESLQ